jgi:hypothetical protein
MRVGLDEERRLWRRKRLSGSVEGVNHALTHDESHAFEDHHIL